VNALRSRPVPPFLFPIFPIVLIVGCAIPRPPT